VTFESTTVDTGHEQIRNRQPLYLIVGERQVSPCDHDTFGRFKLWVAVNLTSGSVETYAVGAVSIDHWDEQASDDFPHLLNPCECGTYLPIEVEPGPMLASAVGLQADLSRLIRHRADMHPAFHRLFDSMLEMTNLSIDANISLEIR